MRQQMFRVTCLPIYLPRYCSVVPVHRCFRNSRGSIVNALMRGLNTSLEHLKMQLDFLRARAAFEQVDLSSHHSDG